MGLLSLPGISAVTCIFPALGSKLLVPQWPVLWEGHRHGSKAWPPRPTGSWSENRAGVSTHVTKRGVTGCPGTPVPGSPHSAAVGEQRGRQALAQADGAGLVQTVLVPTATGDTACAHATWTWSQVRCQGGTQQIHRSNRQQRCAANAARFIGERLPWAERPEQQLWAGPAGTALAGWHCGGVVLSGTRPCAWVSACVWSTGRTRAGRVNVPYVTHSRSLAAPPITSRSDCLWLQTRPHPCSEGRSSVHEEN